MRGDVIYHVYGMHEGRKKDVYFGAFATRQEAQAEIERLKIKMMKGYNWAAEHHNKGFEIRETIVNTDFEIPPQPKPRDKYVIKAIQTNEPGKWVSITVEVYRRNIATGALDQVCEYERNHTLFQTFEPFRQGSRELALISRDYTRTAVLDLANGNIIAEEAKNGLPGSGFCPVGFYVPDWWDVNDGYNIPGSNYWSSDEEWPIGDFGFVWGCNWGDDNSWKVQYLDLSQVQQGTISRQERFGYVELATKGFNNPCVTIEPIVLPKKTPPPHFITVWRYKGIIKVRFAVEMAFDLGAGEPEDWKRLRIKDFE